MSAVAKIGTSSQNLVWKGKTHTQKKLLKGK